MRRSPSACAICYALTGVGVAARHYSAPHRMYVCANHFKYLTMGGPLNPPKEREPR